MILGEKATHKNKASPPNIFEVKENVFFDKFIHLIEKYVSMDKNEIHLYTCLGGVDDPMFYDRKGISEMEKEIYNKSMIRNSKKFWRNFKNQYEGIYGSTVISDTDTA